MGMGEPLLNLPSVLRAHEILNKEIGIGESAHRRWVAKGPVPTAASRLGSQPASQPGRALCSVAGEAAAQHDDIPLIEIHRLSNG